MICTLIPDDVIPELPITPKPDALRREAVAQVGVDTPFVAAMPRSEDKLTMSEASQPVTILSESESWNLLASVPLGRLVTSVDGQPQIFPVNFAVQHRTVLFRTAQGTKLVDAVINNRVLFEADDHTAIEGWSVIVNGTAQILRTDEEIQEAEKARLVTWTATVKEHYVRVLALQVTGRLFRFGPEPGRESTVA